MRTRNSCPVLLAMSPLGRPRSKHRAQCRALNVVPATDGEAAASGERALRSLQEMRRPRGRQGPETPLASYLAEVRKRGSDPVVVMDDGTTIATCTAGPDDSDRRGRAGHRQRDPAQDFPGALRASRACPCTDPFAAVVGERLALRPAAKIARTAEFPPDARPGFRAGRARATHARRGDGTVSRAAMSWSSTPCSAIRPLTWRAPSRDGSLAGRPCGDRARRRTAATRSASGARRLVGRRSPPPAYLTSTSLDGSLVELLRVGRVAEQVVRR